MTTDTKKLAEFATEFLGSSLINAGAFSVIVNENNLFKGNTTAPLLAHLALREIEKRGLEVRIDTYNAKGAFNKRTRVYIRKDSHKDSASWDWELADWCEQAENYFIALWSAIEATGEK